MTRTWRPAIALLLLAAACSRNPTTNAGTLTIAVVPKGTSHAFWQSIHAGAARAAKELNVSIVWRGPLREDERESQISEVERFISSGISGLVLAPLDDVALAQPVADARRNNIPVVVIDSGVKGNDYVSFVATDNRLAGRMAGDQLAALLHDKGRVMMLRYAEGSESTIQREEGFLEALKQHPGVQIVSGNQYGGADVEGAYKKSEAVLSGLKRADGTLDLDGVFTPNESTTLAMMRVLVDNGWAGRIRFVGFDASDTSGQGHAGRPYRCAGRSGSGQDGVSRRQNRGRTIFAARRSNRGSTPASRWSRAIGWTIRRSANCCIPI